MRTGHKSILIPDRGPIDRRRIRPDRRDRRERPDRNRRDRRNIIHEEDEGLDWDVRRDSGAADDAGIADSTIRWIKQNIPDAPRDEIADVADVFYDAADAIYDGKTNSPTRSIAYLKRGLLQAAGTEWDDFFENLTRKIAKEDVTEIADIADIYEEIADALYDAAGDRDYWSPLRTSAAVAAELSPPPAPEAAQMIQEGTVKPTEIISEQKESEKAAPAATKPAATVIKPAAVSYPAGPCADGQCYINGRGY